MNDIGRHFRLESELKGVLLAVAAVVMVSGAYMTLVTQSTGTHPLITDSAGIATTTSGLYESQGMTMTTSVATLILA